MRTRGEWRLPALRSGYPADADLGGRRVRAAGGAIGAGATEREIGGIRCLVIGAGERTVLYLHGGGYRMGRPEAWVSYAARLAEASGARFVLPDYRLAPEHPFPAGLHDAVAVYRALAERGPLVVAGDSAGAGLSCALAIAAHGAGAPVAGAVLISPMLDFAARDATYDSNAARDAFFSRQSVIDCGEAYLQGHPADDPLVSPLLADPETLPPMLVLAGGAEVLLGEAIAFATRVALADRRVTLHVAPGMGHVWPMLAPDTPEAADAIAVIGLFARATLP